MSDLTLHSLIIPPCPLIKFNVCEINLIYNRGCEKKETNKKPRKTHKEEPIHQKRKNRPGNVAQVTEQCAGDASEGSWVQSLMDLSLAENSPTSPQAQLGMNLTIIFNGVMQERPQIADIIDSCP